MRFIVAYVKFKVSGFSPTRFNVLSSADQAASVSLASFFASISDALRKSACVCLLIGSRAAALNKSGIASGLSDASSNANAALALTVLLLLDNELCSAGILRSSLPVRAVSL